MHKYSINISLNGSHWARMELAQGTSEVDAKYKAKLTSEKFASEDGYKVTLGKWTNPVGQDISF